jgi:hypothetical protein
MLTPPIVTPSLEDNFNWAQKLIWLLTCDNFEFRLIRVEDSIAFLKMAETYVIIMNIERSLNYFGFTTMSTRKEAI